MEKIINIAQWELMCIMRSKSLIQATVKTSHDTFVRSLRHLHPTMCEESTEDHQRLLPPDPWTLLAATIRQTVPQHQDLKQQNARQLLPRRPSDCWTPDSKRYSPTYPYPSHWIPSTHQSHWLWQHCSMSCTAQLRTHAAPSSLLH